MPRGVLSPVTIVDALDRAAVVVAYNWNTFQCLGRMFTANYHLAMGGRYVNIGTDPVKCHTLELSICNPIMQMSFYTSKGTDLFA